MQSICPGCSFHLGVEQALHVVDANGNNRLDAGDSITLYAAAVPAAYRKYTKYNVYWLIDADSASPLRMSSINGTPAAGPLAVSHTCTAAPRAGPVRIGSRPGVRDGMDRWIFLLVCGGRRLRRRGAHGLQPVAARGALNGGI